MPHTLPGPFLELSTANLHLNDLSVDQLAALWNVFTKVGDSLHKGRRLENFVWRAWHREAHLLPPDASWSDFADCTPLETPALSRAGSISQGFQRRPVISQNPQGHWAGKEDDNAPSDPESGAGWSDESEDESSTTTQIKVAPKTSTIAGPSTSKTEEADRPRSALPVSDRGRPSGRPQGNKIVIPATTEVAAAQSPTQAMATSTSTRRRLGEASLLSNFEASNDRKRAASSSAFGSRARVRYSNLRKVNRPRPLSFQAALESLATGTESDDLTRLAQEHQKRGLGVAHERRSFQETAAIDLFKPGGIAEDGEEGDEMLIAASHSSAPAGSGFEARHAGITEDAQTEVREPTPVKGMHEAKGDPAREGSQDSRMMPPPALPASRTIAATSEEKKDKTPDQKSTSQAQPLPAATRESKAHQEGQSTSKKAKFFLSASVSKSFDEDDHHYSGSPDEPPRTTRDDRGASNLADGEAKIKQGNDGTSPVKETRSKVDGLTSALSGGHRSRSGASLHKGKGKAGGSRTGSSGRLAASGLMMTKAAAQPAALAPSANTKPPAKPALVSRPQPAKKNKPVKFTMGGGEDEDENEFTDEANDPESEQPLAPAPPPVEKKVELTPTPAAQGPPASTKSGKQASASVSHTEPRTKGLEVIEVVDGDDWQNDDDEEWSSDTSAEAAEERRRVEEAAHRRRRAEEEHQKALFKKIPIRSASTADLPNMALQRPKTPVAADQPSAQPAPARGLLSSLFHPEQEPHPPPGQLHGRPHASAADLRGGPGTQIPRPASTTGHKPDRRQHRPPSLIGSLPRALEAGGTLKMSKSAVALPVLNTVSTLDVAAGDSDAEEDYQVVSNSRRNTGSSTHRSTSRRSQQGLVVVESPESSRTLQEQQDRVARRASQSRERRASSTASHPSPPSAKETTPQEPLPATAVASHRRESNPLPTPAAPQTPRTTRRNMLRDELSESLRQNLLWERQSRNRMLGIGGNTGRAATTGHESVSTAGEDGRGGGGGDAPHPPAPAPRGQRRETVLGGGQLRPLTQGTHTTAAGAGAGAGGQVKQSRPPPSHHQHSRSTPHLPHAAGNSSTSSTATSNLPAAGHTNGNGGLLLHPPAFQRSRSGPTSSSTQTSDDDDDGSTSAEPVGRIRPDGETGGLTKKKAMWPGGFPDYHQHGW